MTNVTNFPTKFKAFQNNSWLAGYAAGLADASRNGHDIFELIKESGLMLEQFKISGADEYDLEELQKAYGDTD